VSFERADGGCTRRVDTGVREGDAISPFYDSMVAKLIVWGDDRAQALARLDAALRDTHIVGLHTNVAFLRRVVASRAFATADLDTALIERERAALFKQPPLALEMAAAGVVAHALAAKPLPRAPTPGRAATAGACTAARAAGFDLQHAGATLRHGAAARRRAPAVGSGRPALAAAGHALGRRAGMTCARRPAPDLTVYAQGERYASSRGRCAPCCSRSTRSPTPAKVPAEGGR
jgi:3-methylcrotonyl-CoA carboxylase alpha subunit